MHKVIFRCLHSKDPVIFEAGSTLNPKGRVELVDVKMELNISLIFYLVKVRINPSIPIWVTLILKEIVDMCLGSMSLSKMKVRYSLTPFFHMVS